MLYVQQEEKLRNAALIKTSAPVFLVNRKEFAFL
jgi:hypothetical protein